MPTAEGADVAAPPCASGAPSDAPATPEAAAPKPSHAPSTPAKPPLEPLDAVVYAPELPIDLLRRVFAPLAGDSETLSAAACVCRAWHAAALEPSLWRRACLSFAPRAARRLTDGALAALVARTGDALERVNLAGCSRLTIKGVAEALKGKQLATLALRGVRSGQRNAGTKVMPLLRALVRRPTGLDLRQHALCGGMQPLTPSRRCTRLCAPVDTLCDTCGVVRCRQCTAFSQHQRKPPCAHLCDGCFHAGTAGDELSPCGACGSVPNGFCDSCLRECNACGDAAFCKGCCFAGGALVACDGPDCGAAFCEPCGLDDFNAQLVACDVCAKHFCEECAFGPEQLLLTCEGCDDAHCCLACAYLYLNEAGEVVCPDCTGPLSDDSELDSDDGGGSGL